MISLTLLGMVGASVIGDVEMAVYLLPDSNEFSLP